MASLVGSIKAVSKFTFKSFYKKVEKEMDTAARRQRAKAAQFVKKLLLNASKIKFGADSDITKGIAYRSKKDYALVGVGAPGNRAHWIEFGTDARYTRAGKPTGHIVANPFVFPTFVAATPGVKKILMESWF